MLAEYKARGTRLTNIMKNENDVTSCSKDRFQGLFEEFVRKETEIQVILPHRNQKRKRPSIQLPGKNPDRGVCDAKELTDEFAF